jgi:hypothetical protein
MNTTPTNPSSITHNTGVPPVPPEAHQGTDFRTAGTKGDKRVVKMNGSRIEMEHDGRGWINTRVTPIW